MSYYGVSVLIIILVTSLTAFYLLYKAKELNMGILISISLGSLILGFSFVPLFKLMYGILSENISLNNPFTLVITLLIEFFVFLLFVCMISIIISICIPKKIISVDCCVLIDKFRDNISRNKGGISGKTDNSADDANMLKKSVDTNQIIDTMGIEKGENSKNDEKYASNVEKCHISEESIPVAELQSEHAITSGSVEEHSSEFTEEYIPVIAEVCTPESVEEYAVEVAETVEIVETIEAAATVEVAEVIETVEVDDIIEATEVIEAAEAVETAAVAEADIYEAEMPEIQASTLNTNETIDGSEYDIQKDNTFNNIITENIEVLNAQTLIFKAFEYKKAGEKDKAIEHYMEALKHQPDNNMVFWIVLDVCALYKQMGLNALAVSILEEIVNKYNSIIQPEVKSEILNNLK